MANNPLPKPSAPPMTPGSSPSVGAPVGGNGQVQNERPVVVATNNPIQAAPNQAAPRGPATPSPVLQELNQAKSNPPAARPNIPTQNQAPSQNVGQNPGQNPGVPAQRPSLPTNAPAPMPRPPVATAHMPPAANRPPQGGLPNSGAPALAPKMPNSGMPNTNPNGLNGSNGLNPQPPKSPVPGNAVPSSPVPVSPAQRPSLPNNVPTAPVPTQNNQQRPQLSPAVPVVAAAAVAAPQVVGAKSVPPVPPSVAPVTPTTNTIPKIAGAPNTPSNGASLPPRPPVATAPVSGVPQTAPAGGNPPSTLAASRIAPANAVAPGAASPSAIPTPPGSKPIAAPVTGQPPRPPASLSALSSMTSNKLPPSSGIPPVPPPAGGSSTQTSSANVTANPKIPAPGSGGPQPAVAKSKLPMRLIAIIGGVLLLLGIIAFVAMSFFSGNNSSTNTPTNQPNTPSTPTKQTSIEYWGLWEPSEVMATVLADFEKQNPGVTVNYRKQSAQDYRTRLANAIASGNGPDLFRFHASWVPMLREELAPMPNSVMDVATYQKTFYPIATYQLQNNGQIVGIPLMYDGLALYYNEDIFKTADIQPPKTWSELQTYAVKLTVKQNNRIQRAGVAMGNAENVEHFSDIIALLMLQNGADLTQPNSAETRDALLFYVNFVKQLTVWDTTLPSSTTAFARGEAAMMLAPSWRAFEIQQMNPDLKFAIAPVPQLPESTRIAWGSYWAEGVNSKGKNKDISWALLKYMSSAEVMKKLHADQAKSRSFGEIYSRTDLAEELAANPKIQAFLQDAPYAQSGYLNSATHDAGLNDQLIQYYKDAVNALLQGKATEDVLLTLDKGTQQVLRQYTVE